MRIFKLERFVDSRHFENFAADVQVCVSSRQLNCQDPIGAMDFLKAEVERRKQQLAAANAASGGTGVVTSADGRKVYVRKGDIATRLEASTSGNAAIPSIPSALSTSASGDSDTNTGSHSIAGSSAANSSGAVTSKTSNSSASAPTSAVSPGLPRTQLPKAEVVRRLRKHGLVVTYFGEDDSDRLRRLVDWENEHLNEDLAISGGHETANAFLESDRRRAAAYGARLDDGGSDDEDDEEEASPAVKRRRDDPDVASAELAAADASGDGDGSAHGGGEDSEDDDASAGSGGDGRGGSTDASRTAAAAAACGGAGAGSGGDSSKHTFTHEAAIGYRKKDDYKFLYKFWKGLLHEWEIDIGTRHETLTATAVGRQEIKMCKQAKDYLRAFFKHCKRKTLPDDIRDLVLEITDKLLAFDYKAAGDAYMSLAVGNAQWLIGVSQVGLHERAAREKVYLGKITHVMNDEAQRKYITSLKRLMTFLQKKKPSNPSQMLLTYIPENLGM